jgi:AcrR family transcriptional regulator
VPQPPRTARGEKTRDALRRAAQVRFLAQGVEDTSAEQIAADAGVSLRTFYRHFASKHELLFGDYDASLAWFRSALEARPLDESVTESVLAAIYSFPFDRESMFEIAALRSRQVERPQVERHIQQVQGELALEVEHHLLRQRTPADGDIDTRFEITVAARCIAAAIFAAVDTWMQGDHADLEGLAHLTELALHSLAGGMASSVAKVSKLT